MLFLISSVYHCASGPESRHMKSLQVTGKSQHWSLKNNFNGTASLQGNHQELTPLCMRSLKSSLQTLENGKTSVLRCGFSKGSWASIPGWAVTTGPHWTSLWSSWYWEPNLDDSKGVPLLASDLPAGAANTISGTWKDTSLYTRLNGLLKSVREPSRHPQREHRLPSLLSTTEGMVVAWFPPCPVHHAFLCPRLQLALSPALAYPPASAASSYLLWYLFWFAFNHFLLYTIPFFNLVSLFPPHSLSSHHQLSVTGVPPNASQWSFTWGLLPHQVHKFTQRTNVFVRNHLYPPVLGRKNCLLFSLGMASVALAVQTYH